MFTLPAFNSDKKAPLNALTLIPKAIKKWARAFCRTYAIENKARRAHYFLLFVLLNNHQISTCQINFYTISFLAF